MHSSESSDICRLLAPRSLPILSSSPLRSIRRPPYLPSRTPLFHSFTFFLLASLLLTLFLYLVPPRLPSDRPRDGADPRQERAVCLALQARLPTTWIVKTSGRHPARWCTVNQAFAYRIFDLQPGDALAMTSRAAPRRVGVNAEMYALRRAEPRVTLRGVVRLSLGWDNFQDARPLETRARALSNGPRRAAFLLPFDTRHWSMTHLSRRN